MTSAGSAYLVAPDAGSGPGVLVLHSWWGLTPFFRSVCDRLADEGFVALAPDILGAVADTPDEAEANLMAHDPNRGARLVLASAATLRDMPITTGEAIGVVGFSMGASWGLWLSARAADTVRAVVSFYGSQDIDFAGSRSAYLGHFADNDSFVTDDEVESLEANLRGHGLEVEFHRYPGTTHWFFERDRAVAYEPDAAEAAWARTVAFLHAHLD
ncbi:MAG TPA: dienelactone hydrolase family protein [Acidimicrobiales bacterium]|nr:dienelactone hydrolase family protein [Acidimicrobiales bacterium]